MVAEALLIRTHLTKQAANTTAKGIRIQAYDATLMTTNQPANMVSSEKRHRELDRHSMFHQDSGIHLAYGNVVTQHQTHLNNNLCLEFSSNLRHTRTMFIVRGMGNALACQIKTSFLQTSTSRMGKASPTSSKAYYFQQ